MPSIGKISEFFHRSIPPSSTIRDRSGGPIRHWQGIPASAGNVPAEFIPALIHVKSCIAGIYSVFLSNYPFGCGLGLVRGDEETDSLRHSGPPNEIYLKGLFIAVIWEIYNLALCSRRNEEMSSAV
jgi:hypothetical protein